MSLTKPTIIIFFHQSNKQEGAFLRNSPFWNPPLLLVDGDPGVSALHDLGHGGEVQHGRAGQHEAVLQRGQDVLHRLAAQHPATELLLHKLTVGKRQG